MNTVTKIARHFYGLYFYLVFALVFILLFPAFLFFLSNEKRYYNANRLRKFWARTVLWLAGYSLNVQFESKIDTSKPAVFCANHTSLLDICVFALIFDINYRYMAKAEFGKIPLFGIFFKTVDIAVNRSNKKDSYTAWKLASDSIDKGFSMVIFPEGTTSPLDGSLRKFKNGPFKLAMDKAVPVVPITYLNHWELFHYDRGLYAMPGRIEVIVHAPLETAHLAYEDLPLLREKVYNTINQTLVSTYGSRQAVS